MMANIAVIFHFSLADMQQLSLVELAEWHERAVDRTGKDD